MTIKNYRNLLFLLFSYDSHENLKLGFIILKSFIEAYINFSDWIPAQHSTKIKGLFSSKLQPRSLHHKLTNL